MESQDNIFYHYHRLGSHDELWQDEKNILVDDDFASSFYESIITEQRELEKRFGDYEIDKIIMAMENVKRREKLNYGLYHIMDYGVNGCYMLRRELALEEGRKIFNPSAPSRLHTVYLTDKESIIYWYRYLGGVSKVYKVEALGEVFESSDYLFPNIQAPLEKQIEDSKEYWQPKKLSYGLPREYLLKGSLRIKKEEEEL